MTENWGYIEIDRDEVKLFADKSSENREDIKRTHKLILLFKKTIIRLSRIIAFLLIVSLTISFILFKNKVSLNIPYTGKEIIEIILNSDNLVFNFLSLCLVLLTISIFFGGKRLERRFSLSYYSPWGSDFWRPSRHLIYVIFAWGIIAYLSISIIEMLNPESLNKVQLTVSTDCKDETCESLTIILENIE